MPRRYTRWRGRSVPSSIFEPAQVEIWQCAWCADTGSVPERIDDERDEVLVPCLNCRRFCVPCGKWVKFGLHECKGKS